MVKKYKNQKFDLLIINIYLDALIDIKMQHIKGYYISCVICILICCFLPALLLMFVGYNQAKEWNNGLNKTGCNITSHIIRNETCYLECNDIPSDYGICTICYDGFINITYQVNTTNYTNVFKIYRTYTNKNLLANKLEKNYPINHSIYCYYQKNNPLTVRLHHKFTDIFSIKKLIYFIIKYSISYFTLFF